MNILMIKNKLLMIIIISIIISMLIPIKTHASTTSKWRSEVRYQLKRHHIWSKTKENKILHIISKESGGRTSARNGSCVGLLQFNSGWKHNYSKAWCKRNSIHGTYHKDNRLNGSWSIRRIVMAYKVGGTSCVRRNWIQTYY